MEGITINNIKRLITCIIVDDEPWAHEVLSYHIERHADLELIGQMKSATETIKWLANNSVDLIFLDVNMPEISGVEMLRVLAVKVNVIFVSAHKEYALDGFELDAIDYLLKPVDDERFDKAIGKLKSQMNIESSKKETLTIKQDRGFKVLSLDDISLLQGYGNYVKIWQGNDMVLANSTLKSVLHDLPEHKFIQVSKSSIINKHKVHEVNAKEVTLTCGNTVKISKLYVNDIKQLLG